MKRFSACVITLLVAVSMFDGSRDRPGHRDSSGIGIAGFNGDGITATTAQLNFPYGVAVDAAGNLFIAEKNNHRIRQVAGGRSPRWPGPE